MKKLYYFQARFNKTYVGKCEKNRRKAWEENIIKIYEHNLLAEAGHYEFFLRDNFIADLGTKDYIRQLVCIYFLEPMQISIYIATFYTVLD